MIPQLYEIEMETTEIERLCQSDLEKMCWIQIVDWFAKFTEEILLLMRMGQIEKSRRELQETKSYLDRKVTELIAEYKEG